MIKHLSIRQNAFTLVELIAVMGIMGIGFSLLIPAVNSLTGNAGRNGGITQIIATLDQARVAAIQNGNPVFVGFANQGFPKDNYRFRAYIVFRRGTIEDKAQGASQPPNFVFLTKWRTLPLGVSFSSGVTASALADASGSVITVNPGDAFPSISKGEIPVIQFGSNGNVIAPSSQYLSLYMYEGFYDGKDVVTGSRGGLLDVITVTRFTGRPRLEVSNEVQL